MDVLKIFGESISNQTSRSASNAGAGDAQDIIKTVLTSVYLVIGIAAVIFIILGGINYVTSQGDPNKIKKAKDTILYAVIGLVAALLAFAITTFILDKIKG